MTIATLDLGQHWVSEKYTIDQLKYKIIFYKHGDYKSDIRHSMTDFILMLLSWSLGAVLSLRLHSLLVGLYPNTFHKNTEHPGIRIKVSFFLLI